MEQGGVVLVGLEALLEGEGGGEPGVCVAEVELLVEHHEDVVVVHNRVHLPSQER